MAIGGDIALELTHLFSPDYRTARERFRETAVQLGWELEAHTIGMQGPHGEDLTIDVALSPDRGSEKCLVVSSGVHGVEGFFGSAVQLGTLQQWSRVAQPQVRCVFLHGLNPYGFAWSRRFNENNVDLNRNFLIDGQAYAGAPNGYSELNALLNPERPPSSWEPFTISAALAVARYGMPALKQAIATGQYDFPKGLFYGGSGPSRMHDLLSTHLRRWLNGSRDVMHLDFHTGLGKHGDYKLLIDYPLTESQVQRLTNWFGADVFEASTTQGIAYETRGGLGRWCISKKLADEYLFASAEFGTYKPIRMLGGMRRENQAHHWGVSTSASTKRAKADLRELFGPASDSWRESVLTRSLTLIERAVDGLSSNPGAIIK